MCPHDDRVRGLGARPEPQEDPHPANAREGARGLPASLRFFLAPLAMMATGCLGTQIYVDERFTPEEEQEIRAAAEMWSDATSGAASVDLVYGQRVDLLDKGRRVMVRAGARAAENLFPLFRDGDPGGHHLSWDTEMIIIVPERLEGIDMKYVVTHELGHHFGVKHVQDERAIMHYRPNPLSLHCLTTNDLAAFCTSNGCEVSAMQPCNDGIGRRVAESVKRKSDEPRR